STLHTNSAIGAISRLKDLGVRPFLIADSLIVGSFKYSFSSSGGL
ncbi:MAG: Flp pilus assembly complex ATPase component TadA, partial [Deltaproteobacteria bacterium]|nr:Flp pilus assembly complex ATPase component TadA [Deltaproteobacteria bacterium]